MTGGEGVRGSRSGGSGAGLSFSLQVTARQFAYTVNPHSPNMIDEQQWRVGDTAAFVCERGFTAVALQLPDELLHAAADLAHAVHAACAARGAAVQVGSGRRSPPAAARRRAAAAAACSVTGPAEAPPLLRQLPSDFHSCRSTSWRTPPTTA